jgi:SMODS and SLOG-associating 2TM effector domain 3/SMODS and SLOG-associating 2TM effector domain 1
MQSSPSPLQLTDAEMPALFRLADRASIQAQRRFFRRLAAELSLLSLGTLAGLFGAFTPTVGSLTFAGLSVPAFPVAEVAAAILIFVALVIRLTRFLAHPDSRWYEARAVAESAKSIAWRYAVGGSPFDLGKDAAVVDTLLRQRLQESLTDVPKRSRAIIFSDQGQITDTMRALRGQPLAIRQEAYLAGRIKDQAGWYDRKQRQNHDRALLAQWTLALLEVLGVIFALLQARKLVTINLQALTAALVAAGIAWTQAQRYQDLSATYRVAAKEALALEHSVPAQPTEDAWARFVDDAEAAFSREHRLWRATRDEK